MDTDLDFQTLKAFRMLLLKTDGSRKKKRVKVNLILNDNYSNQDLFGSNECLSASKRDEPNHDINYHHHEQHLHEEHQHWRWI